MRQLDVKRLLNAVGGKTDAHAMLSASGCVVTMKAIDKWLSRGSMPSYALVTFLLAAKKKGININIEDFTHENY